MARSPSAFSPAFLRLMNTQTDACAPIWCEAVLQDDLLALIRGCMLPSDIALPATPTCRGLRRAGQRKEPRRGRRGPIVSGAGSVMAGRIGCWPGVGPIDAGRCINRPALESPRPAPVPRAPARG